MGELYMKAKELYYRINREILNSKYPLFLLFNNILKNASLSNTI